MLLARLEVSNSLFFFTLCFTPAVRSQFGVHNFKVIVDFGSWLGLEYEVYGGRLISGRRRLLSTATAIVVFNMVFTVVQWALAGA